MKHQLIYIIVSLLRVKGNDPFRMTEPVTVRLSPLAWPLEIYGLQVSPKKELYVMTFSDGHGYDVEHWEKLEEEDENLEVVVASIYQRVKSIFKQAA